MTVKIFVNKKNLSKNCRVIKCYFYQLQPLQLQSTTTTTTTATNNFTNTTRPTATTTTTNYYYNMIQLLEKENVVPRQMGVVWLVAHEFGFIPRRSSSNMCINTYT